MAPKTIVLAVDSDGASLRSIKEGLEAHPDPFIVDCAKDASECLSRLDKQKPDLILINTLLPDMDGFSLRARLRLTQSKEVPVIYLVEKCDPTLTRKVGLLTADDFILKPINLPELVLRIQKLRMFGCYRKKAKPTTLGQKDNTRRRSHNQFGTCQRLRQQ